MANERKDKFELKKDAGHNFDISKKGKRKFDLTKDLEERKPSVSSVPKTIPPAQAQKPEPEKPLQAAIPKPTLIQDKPTSPNPTQAQGKTSAPVKPVQPQESTSKKPSTQSNSVTPPSTVIETAEEEKDKGKPWLWIVIVLIALILIAWWCFRSCTHEEEKKLGEEKVEQVAPIPNGGAESVEGVEETSTENTTQETATQDNSVAASSDSAGSSVSTAQGSVPPTSASPTPSSPTSTPAKTTVPQDVTDNIEQEALNVIRGIYGDGAIRKRKLGDKYAIIQARVNEMKRQGLF